MPKRKATLPDIKLDETKIEVIHAEDPTKSEATAPVVEVSTEEACAEPAKPPRRTKVAIVGFTPTRDLAPYQNPDFDIWALNDLFEAIPRYDRIYQIHKRQSIDTHTTRGEKVTYIKRLRELAVPIYMVEAYPDIPNSVAFPLQEIADYFGYDYFTNTISYMIAHAIYEGYEEIHIYGVDMAVGCLAPETRVLTADLRWVRSDEVEVGDELMGFDEEPDSGTGKTRRWRKATVTAVPRIIRPCYEMEMEDGTRIVASEKHGWLTHGENANRWKTTGELITRYHRPGRPTRILKMVEPWEEDHSYEAGYLAAAFDGEGCFSQRVRPEMPGLYHNNLTFAQRDNPMQDKVAGLLDKYGFKYTIQEKPDCDTRQLRINGGKAENLRFLGQFRPARLLPKFNPEAMGEFQSAKNVAVTATRFLGNREVIGMETDTKTFIAEGFASHNSEFEHQRPSCEFWIGIGVGRGVKFYIPNESDLLKSRFLYGFEEDKEEAFNRKCVASVKMMTERMNAARAQERRVLDAALQYDGGIQVCGEILKKCKDEVTILSLQNTIGQMQRDKTVRETNAGQLRDVASKYEGAIQAIGEIQRTWATCLDNPDPIDVGATSEETQARIRRRLQEREMLPVLRAVQEGGEGR